MLQSFRFIDGEADASARRNAFLFLFNEAEEVAIEFLNSHMDRVKDYGDGFALLVLELCRKVRGFACAFVCVHVCVCVCVCMCVHMCAQSCWCARCEVYEYVCTYVPV